MVRTSFLTRAVGVLLTGFFIDSFFGYFSVVPWVPYKCFGRLGPPRARLEEVLLRGLGVAGVSELGCRHLCRFCRVRREVWLKDTRYGQGVGKVKCGWLKDKGSVVV